MQAILGEDPLHFATQEKTFVVACGEVWFEKVGSGNFKISGFRISRFRSAGMSIEDCYKVRDFVSELQTAVAQGDKERVAGMFHYPFRYHGEQKVSSIRRPQQAVGNYDTIFSSDLRKVLSDQKIWQLESMTDGVAIGNGNIWVSDVSGKGDFKVTSIFKPAAVQ